MTTLLTLFGALFVVNLFTIGGGYVMIPMLHDIFVERFGWLTNKEFIDAVAMGQLTPGPLTLMNAFIGYKVMGLAGAVTAAAGTYLPSLFVVTYVTKYYLKFKGSKAVDAVLRGIKPAVAGMLAAVALKLGGETMTEPLTIGLGAGSFLLMSFTKIDPTIIIIGSGAAGYFLL